MAVQPNNARHAAGPVPAVTLWPIKYIGLPFRDRGRDWKGVDCWGLIALVLRHEKNITVNDYGEISANEMIAIARRMMADSEADPWHKVMSPRMFDIVVMSAVARMDGRGRHVPMHVGIMVDDKSVLHIEDRFDSVCVPLKHPDVRFRIVGFYRHKELLA